MSKKYLILNALIALTLMGCNPGSGKKKAQDTKKGTDVVKNEDKDSLSKLGYEKEGAEVTAEGIVVPRAKIAISKLELDRLEDFPLSLKLSIEFDSPKSQYVVSILKYGRQGEASDRKLALSAKSKFVPALNSIFKGEQVIVHQPIPEGGQVNSGAGATSITLTPVKDPSQKLIVREPQLEKGRQNFFLDLVAEVHAYMKKETQPENETAPTESKLTSTLAKAEDCKKLDLAGDWHYDLSEGTLGRSAVSTLTPMQTTDGSVQFSSKDVLTEQGCFGGPVTKEETSVVALEAESCRILSKDSSGKVTAFLIQSLLAEGSEAAGFVMQQCQDLECKSLQQEVQAIEMLRKKEHVKRRGWE